MFSIVFTGATPSRKMIHAKLAAMINAPKNQVVIGSLSNRFGLTQVSGDARVYATPEDLKKIELDYIIKRGMTGEEESDADAQDAPSEDAAEAS